MQSPAPAAASLRTSLGITASCSCTAPLLVPNRFFFQAPGMCKGLLVGTQLPEGELLSTPFSPVRLLRDDSRTKQSLSVQVVAVIQCLAECLTKPCWLPTKAVLRCGWIRGRGISSATVQTQQMWTKGLHTSLRHENIPALPSLQKSGVCSTRRAPTPPLDRPHVAQLPDLFGLTHVVYLGLLSLIRAMLFLRILWVCIWLHCNHSWSNLGSFLSCVSQERKPAREELLPEQRSPTRMRLGSWCWSI